MANATAYVYALCEPDTLMVRYIGWSGCPAVRFRKHLRDAYTETYHKARWIRKLLSVGKKPQLVILKSCDLLDAPILEKACIALLRSCGMDLTNCTDGGEGSTNPSDETRKKMSDAKVGKPGWWRGKHHDPEFMRQLTMSRIGLAPWNKGIAPSDDHREAMRKAAIRRANTEEGKMHLRTAGRRGAEVRWKIV